MVKPSLAVLCLIIGLFLHGCSGGGAAGSGDAFRYDPGIPGQVTGVQAASGNRLVTLSWTSQYVATSYNIYYAAATASGAIVVADAIKVNVTTNSYVLQGLTNNVTYYFMVTAQNTDGEGAGSAQASATPGPIIQADLAGTWYFHTLVSGPSAKWERGTLVIDDSGNATFTDFLDSAHYNPVDDSSTAVTLPSSVAITVQGDGTLASSGTGEFGADFHGDMGSRKNMMLGTWTYSVDGSKALTIFQKQRATNDYSVWDIAGTSSGQNPEYPTLAGNGPTRYAYHGLNSGSSIQWEYSNARVGQQAQFWNPPISTLFPAGQGSIKDIIYWDYSTPTYKTAPGYDFLWKVTCFGIQPDGLVKEYDSFATIKDGSHNVIFTGRMTDDKTVVVGVSTKNDIPAGQTSTGAITTIPDQYYLRILQLNFIPTDQALPIYTLSDVAGTYKFYKIGAVNVSAGVSRASWAFGRMQVTGSGVTTFPQYTDSNSLLSTPDTFSLAYYPDTGSEGHTWTSFANFVTPNTGDGNSRYYDAYGQPYLSVWTFWESPVSPVPISTSYYNEHGTLSYNRDLFVMSRTDSFGYSMIVGLK